MHELIEKAWKDRAMLRDEEVVIAIEGVIEKLDRGELRVAEPSAPLGLTATPSGSPVAPSGAGSPVTPSGAGSPVTPSGAEAWKVNEWVKKAVLMYFPIKQMITMEVGPLEFHDKIPLKTRYAQLGVRVVPHAIARHGSYLAPGVILMPSYVNIGAYVDEGTMVDTWATVGSCAQIGKHVHLSGGVGIGGVLEPVQAAPVIIEDGCFIGSRAIVVEGVHVGKEAVLGANVVLTASTRIIDITGPEPKEMKGYVPPRSVVIPGTVPKKFPAGEYGVPCALIIGERKESTDKKTSLNEALREHSVAV